MRENVSCKPDYQTIHKVLQITQKRLDYLEEFPQRWSPLRRNLFRC